MRQKVEFEGDESKVLTGSPHDQMQICARQVLPRMKQLGFSPCVERPHETEGNRSTRGPGDGIRKDFDCFPSPELPFIKQKEMTLGLI